MSEIERHLQIIAGNLSFMLNRLIDAHEFVKQNPNATGAQVLLILSGGVQESLSDFRAARDYLKELGITGDKQ